MSTKASPARIHLLAAKEAPIVVVIRRKPSGLSHILRWNTASDEIESGSWFEGKIFGMRCDLSFDGKCMSYLALGSSGEPWSGICHPPFLRTIAHWENTGTYDGGGLFQSPTRFEFNLRYMRDGAIKALEEAKDQFPYEIGILDNLGYGEDEGVLYNRFERDGFQRAGPFGEEKEIKASSYTVVCIDDPGWVKKPSPEHPNLRVRYRGYFGGRGRVFEWDLPEHPGLLDEQVSWAAYDSLGQLVVARLGVLYRYTLKDLLNHTPSAVFDLEPLERPPGPNSDPESSP